MYLDIILPINKISTLSLFFFLNKKLIYFQIKDARILIFRVEHYTIKTDIIRYYLHHWNSVTKNEWLNKYL